MGFADFRDLGILGLRNYWGRAYGGFYFVCDHGKHRHAKRYNFGCNLPSCGDVGGAYMLRIQYMCIYIYIYIYYVYTNKNTRLYISNCAPPGLFSGFWQLRPGAFPRRAMIRCDVIHYIEILCMMS